MSIISHGPKNYLGPEIWVAIVEMFKLLDKGGENSQIIVLSAHHPKVDMTGIIE